ncbi:hypothetical protein F5Y16DRAFT_90263 [Xylariaceae sp. FL0255]|nr:hypothetical protein F5Y16DRAFT_90263 [Xylariaceae sp. FL0255]
MGSRPPNSVTKPSLLESAQRQDASNQQALMKGAKLLKGLTFSPTDTFDSPSDAYKALVAEDGPLPVRQVAAKLAHRVTNLLEVCLQHQDVFVWLRSDDAFWILIQSAWDYPHILASETIKKIFYLFFYARSRFREGWRRTTHEADTHSLTTSLDKFITIMEDLENARHTRNRKALIAPDDVTTQSRSGRQNLTTVWPETYFKPLDIAVLGESMMKKVLFGVNPANKRFTQPKYPTDQSDPVAVRKYLSWLALTEAGPLKKIALFLSPVAFVDHSSRQKWHQVTGHQARYYSTVDEFVAYADGQLGSSDIHIVLGLMTPWFYDPKEVIKYAESRNEDVPSTWQNTCFRSGMMVAIVKLREVKPKKIRPGCWTERYWKHRVFWFRPDQPTYPLAHETTATRDKLDKWITEAFKRIDNADIIRVRENWIGGRALNHKVPNRNVLPDSVEVSCEFITEIMENPATLPTDLIDILERDFVPQRPGSQRLTPDAGSENDDDGNDADDDDSGGGDDNENDDDDDDPEEDSGDEYWEDGYDSASE